MKTLLPLPDSKVRFLAIDKVPNHIPSLLRFFTFVTVIFITQNIRANLPHIKMSAEYSTTDYRTVTGSALLWSDPNIWQKYNGASWNSPGADGIPPNTAGVYINGTVDTNGPRTANKIIIEANGVLTVTGATVCTAQTLVKGGGILQLNAAYTNSGIFEIENRGLVNINYSTASGIASLWNGTENFQAGSTVNIQNWNYSAASGANRLIQNPGLISTISAGFYFGNLIISGSPSSAFVLIRGDQDINLSQNDFTLKSTGKNVILTDGAAQIRLGGNLSVNTGQLSLAATGSGNPSLSIAGNLFVNAGVFDLNQNKSDQSLATLNLEGNFFVAAGGQFTSTDNNSVFNFTRKGNGLSEASRQAVDVFDSANSGNSYIDYFITNGAYVKLINRNFGLGTNSTFTVQNRGILDFGFNDTTALNIIRSQTSTGETQGQFFEAQEGSTLKISSPEGITSGTSLYTGNVQIGADASKRLFSKGATYHYMGKANAEQVSLTGSDQNSGNGLPGAEFSGNVIIDLDTQNLAKDDVSFQARGVHKMTSTATLTILRGKVNDFSGNGFTDDQGANANFAMSGGRYKISRSGTQPAFGGAYNITGGIIEFAGDSDIKIRDKALFMVEVSGTNVSTGAITKGLTFQPGGKFTVKSNATFKVGNEAGLSGGSKTAINTTNNPEIILEDFSTIEYVRAGNQIISPFKSLLSDESNLSTAGYYNLKISGNNGDLVTGTAKRLNEEIYVRNNLEISGKGRLIIDPNKVLTVRRTVINNAEFPTNFIVENEGNLRQIDNVDNIKGISVRRFHHLSPNRKEYNFLASPVKDQNLKYIFGNNDVNIPFVTVYNERTDYYIYAKDSDYKIPGKGFSIKEPIASYLGNTTESLEYNEAEYTGVPNNGDINLTLERTDANHGYNLAGNPYPSNLDIVSLYKNSVINNNIDPTFYFWDNSINDIYTQMGQDYGGYSYAIFNAEAGIDGYGIAAPGKREKAGDAAGSKIPTRLVKTSQGFMIRALAAGAILKFNNSQRKLSSNGGEFFGKHTAEDRYRLEMTSPSGLSLQNAIVYFAGGNYDLGNEDSVLPNSASSDALYMQVNGEKIVINGRGFFKKEDIVSLGTHHFNSGIYKIKVTDREGVFAAVQPIFLKDNVTGVITDISKASYEFQTEAGKFTNRFKIVYLTEKSLGVENATKKNLLIYNEGFEYVVKLNEGKIKGLEVNDMSGRLIYQNKMGGSEIRFNKDILPVGVFVINVIGDNGEIYHKKFRND